MHRIIYVLFFILYISLEADDTSLSTCKPCTEADVIGTVGGAGIGGTIAYSACVAGAIAAGTLTAGAGFVAGMTVCGAATVTGVAAGGEIGHLFGDTVDDYRNCCE